MQTETDHGYLTAGQAANYAGVSIKTVFRWERRGVLRCHRRGRIVRFRREWIDDCLRGGPERPATAALTARRLSLEEVERQLSERGFKV